VERSGFAKAGAAEMDTSKIWGRRRKEEVEMKEWSDQHE
jgi:hypothetical protein